MTPFGDQQPEAPDAGAFLDCYTPAGMIHWTLNVTDVEGFSKAKLVYGNPDITAIDGEHLQSGRRSCSLPAAGQLAAPGSAPVMLQLYQR